ncbi:MAG: SufD family Fe-S cluster assembly protein [Candidatus ainarchaeum sp.]|nr:SufD family Fe-S cluster assembly protein [Candidatus ainarchaeum sp.]
MQMLKTKGSRFELSSGTISVPAGSSAQLLFIYGDEEKESRIRLSAGSSLQIFSVFNSGSKIKNSFSLAENSKLEIHDIFYGNVKVENSIPLENENCSLNLLAKGAIYMNESSSYSAFACIGKNAPGANVNLEEHAYLAEKGAKASLLPGLEINNSNVNARHASSISEPNGEQIFYLMSRGLSEKEAKDEIISGFLSRELAKMKAIFGYEGL